MSVNNTDGLRARLRDAKVSPVVNYLVQANFAAEWFAERAARCADTCSSRLGGVMYDGCDCGAS